MAGFQTAVNLTQAYGVPGEFAYDGPHRSNPWEIISSPQLNKIGATAYTVLTPMTDTNAGVAVAGGTGSFAGILANPKVYANPTGSLGATMTLPDNTIAELVTMGQMLCTLTNAANPGDLVVFDNTTGALSAVPAVTTFTGSMATNVLTVTGTPVGNIGPGLAFTVAGARVTILSNGSGTGGTGTYNLDTTVGTVGSATYTALNNAIASGKTAVPRSKVILRASAANATAIVELTD